MNILVSACLLGENCKYNGGNNFCAKIAELVNDHKVIAVCPEVLGGLPVPRHPAEICDGVVTAVDGTVVDREFRKGAQNALVIGKENMAELAILQPRSPSCGCRQVYDGTFSKRLIAGKGVFAQLLSKNGIRAVDADEFVLHPEEYLR